MSSTNPLETQGIRLLTQLFLRGWRIFTMKEAVEAACIEKIPLKQLKKILYNLAKQGRVIRLRRGLYVAIGLLPKKSDTHPFIISAFLVQPSAISHWSALQYHGLTEQIPQIITASTPLKVVTPSMRNKQAWPPNAKHAWDIGGVRYEYITVQEKHRFGIERVWIDDDFHIYITDKERTLLDLFINSKMFGGIGEALGILENSLPNIDVIKLVDYAIQYNKKSVTKRLGWALEHLGVSAKYLAPLLKISINYYCRLDPSEPAIGPCDKRWMIQSNLIRGNSK